ncbi:MAG: hypothetical protein ACN4GZ_13620 [Acidimicrobiales bacterium]
MKERSRQTSRNRPSTVSATVLSAALIVTMLLPSFVLGSSPAAAEQPSRVIAALRRDGVFVHNTRDNDIDREALVETVNEAERLGYKMAVVIPLDPLPELRSFVLRVQQGGEFDAVIGFGLEGEVEAETSEALDSERLSALRVVRETDGTPEELSALFLTELTTDAPTAVPEIVWRIVRWVAVFVGLLVLAGVLEQVLRNYSRRGQRNQSTA